MSKSKAEKVLAKIEEAQTAEQGALDAAEEARLGYLTALEDGELDTAAHHRAEQSRLEELAKVHADRLEVLEAQRQQAEAEDAKPGYRQAVEVMQAALDSEKAAHDELSELVRQLAEVRSRLPDLHNGANAAIQAAVAAAVAAHEEKPDFRHRSSLTAYPELSKLMGTARELLNVAAHQGQLIHVANERARAA